MKNAENKCSKRSMGGVDFSPEVMVWKKRRDAWDSVIRWHKGLWLNHAIIKRRANACGIQRPLSITVPEDDRAYKICRYEFNILKPDADAYWAKFLARGIKEEVASVNTKKAKNIKSVTDREIARKIWDSIGRYLQKLRVKV